MIIEKECSVHSINLGMCEKGTILNYRGIREGSLFRHEWPFKRVEFRPWGSLPILNLNLVQQG